MRRLLVTLIVVASAWALAVYLTGGINLHLGVAVLRSRDVGRPIIAALAALIAYDVFFHEQLIQDFKLAMAIAGRAATPISCAAAIASAVGAWVWNTCAATGADAYGYVSQAYLWASGTLRVEQPLAAKLTSWRFADHALTPLGYLPQAGGAHAIVPTYAPGLPMLMAVAAKIVGACGPFLVVPLLAGLAVWVTYRLGRRVDTPMTGMAAALLLAASPVFVQQSMVPMTDVPVAALWTATLLLALGGSVGTAFCAGLVGGLALLVRPNLVPLPCVFVIYLLLRDRPWRRGIVKAAAFAAPLALAVAVIAGLNTYWYGAAWKSGYGPTRQLYQWGRAWQNLAGYIQSFVWSQTPFVFLFVLAIVGGLLRSRSADRSPARRDGDDERRQGARHSGALMLAVIAAVWLSYVFYIHFDEWWYIRFLLPALPAMLVLSIVVVRRLTALAPRPWGAMAFAALLTIVFVYQVAFVRRLKIAGPLRYIEHRYIDWSHFVDEKLPRNAAILSMQHSGSLRFYSGRLTVRYDWLDDLAKAPDDLRAVGYQPYLLIEESELPNVRRRLGLAMGAPFPWAVMARMQDPAGVTLYDASSAYTGAPARLKGTDAHDCVYPVAPTWR